VCVVCVCVCVCVFWGGAAADVRQQQVAANTRTTL
jgi:hypothetical protein